MASPNQQQLALIPHAYGGELIAQRASDGYINATAMCRAAGREWSRYRALQSTAEYFAALAPALALSEAQLAVTMYGSPGGDPRNQGTWVHPQVAIHLAQWLSPEFAVKVSEWVYAWLSGGDTRDKAWRQFQDRVALTYDSVPEGYFGVFKESADIYAAMITGGVNPGTKMVLDISVGLTWAKHWRDNALAEKFGASGSYDHNYPGYFPQALSNPQPAACYPEAALPEFRRWMREVYMRQKLPSYLQSQVRQGKLEAPIASNAVDVLQERDRNRARLRKS